METVYITLIIVIGIIVLVYLLKDRLTFFGGNISGRRGENEIGAGMRINAESSRREGTRVSENKMLGTGQTIKTKERGSQIDRNYMKGKNQSIEIGETPEADRPESSENT